jgi:hypothetical protein
MGTRIRLTENDLSRLIKKVINEGADGEMGELSKLETALKNQIPYYKSKPDSLRADFTSPNVTAVGGKLYFDGESQRGMVRLAKLPDNNDTSGPFWVSFDEGVYNLGGGNLRSPYKFKTEQEVVNYIKQYLAPELASPTNESYIWRKIKKLTENDLNRIVKRVIKEDKNIPDCEGIKYIIKGLKGNRSGWTITDEEDRYDTVIINLKDGYEACRAKRSDVFL